MPDRRYTYTVEIDAAQARQAATQLRAMFERELAQIRTGATTGTNGTGSAAQSALRAAELKLRADLSQTTAHIKAEETIRVNVARGESQARIALAKGEARAIAEAAESATAQIKGEENRRTAILKAELREREAAVKASARAQSSAAGAGATTGGMGKLPFGMTVGGLAGGAAAALGIYGADQIARSTYDAGFQGAQQLRTIEAFEMTAERANVSSAQVVRAIRTASKETITSTDAMGLANQLLARKWAASSGDMIGTIETLVKASRKFAQTYLNPETGAAYSVGEVFGRLVKYIGEGNKELVDQFGISTGLIADALGTSTNGLAGAGKEAERAKGLVIALNRELERTGEAGLTLADKFEADTARIDEAWNRIKRNLAEPVSAVVTAAADFTEGAAIKTGTADTDTIRRFAQESNAAYADIGKGSIAGFEELLTTLDKLDAASTKNAEGVKLYRIELTALGQDIINNNGATAEQIARMGELGRALELVSGGQDSWSYAMQATDKKAIESNETLFRIITRMGEMQAAYENGSITLEQYTRTMDALTASMRGVAGAAGLVVREISVVSDQVGTANAAMQAFFNAAPRTANGVPIFAGAIAGQANMAGPSAFNAQQQQDAFDKDRIDAQTQRDAEAREVKKHADEAAANKAASAFESAAKKAQAAFEAAAQKTANEFKSALESVPGLFGTSEVTAGDMALSAVGGYTDKADERLRRLADEVLNRTDTAEDPGDWARRLGLDPGTDPKRVLAEAQARWADSSLFAGGANLDLINRDAIGASLARGDASKAGKEALLKEFGLGPDSPLDEAGQGALKEMLGLGEQELTSAGTEARQAFDAGFYAPAAKGAGDAEAGSGAGMAQTLAAQLKTDIEAGEVADALYGIGTSIFGRIHAGFEDAASNADWSSTLIESLAADVAPLVAEMIADQLPPKP